MIILLAEPYVNNWSMVLSLLFLVIQVTLFIIFIKFEEAIHLKYLNKIYEENLRSIDEQTKRKIKTDVNVKTVYHDLRQHFTSLDGFVNAMSDYLKEMMAASTIDEADRISNTNCIVVDSIINSKYLEAKKNNIDFQTDLNIFADMDINSISLGIILGNALYNAVEATIKLPENKRFIKVTMNYYFAQDNHELALIFMNSYQSVNKRGHQLYTTKADFENHGIGLQSIQNEVGKYNGTCTIDFDDNFFTLKVKLLIKTESISDIMNHRVVQLPP
jgi:sensor histidine kinase regulating citrate/malate metabolism